MKIKCKAKEPRPRRPFTRESLYRFTQHVVMVFILACATRFFKKPSRLQNKVSTVYEVKHTFKGVMVIRRQNPSRNPKMTLT